MRFATITAALLTVAGTAVAADMSALDANGDGMLDAEEFAAAYPDAQPELFVAVDVNADGLIDADEFTVATGTGGLLAG